MAATNGLRSDREITRKLIERIASSELGGKLRSQVASWHPTATRDDVDEAFQEACLLAGYRCRGHTEGEVFTWLRTTTHRELGHMERRSRSRRELPTDVTAPDFHATAATDAAPEEVVIGREDLAEVERVTRAVLARLSERQRQVVALHSHGRRRPEIAQHLGITPRSVKRALEQSMAAGREELVRLAGRGCESGERVVARLAFGLASPREIRQAQHHLTTCPRCGALYERLDFWREKVAAMLPIPAAEQADPGIVERAIHGVTEVVSSAKQRAGEGAAAARDHLADGAAHAKQHANATYYRLVDPTPLAGVRPGAAAAAIAGCLAVGSGATYCVEEGVDPIRVIGEVVRAQREEKGRAEALRRTKRATTAAARPTATASPAPTPTATLEPTPQPSAAPVPSPTAEPETTPEPPPAPQDEYEPVQPTGDPSPATHASSKQSKPAPAPAGGPGEFEP